MHFFSPLVHALELCLRKCSTFINKKKEREKNAFVSAKKYKYPEEDDDNDEERREWK